MIKGFSILFSLALMFTAPVYGYFNDALAENPNYRAISFGMGYESYVDLGSIRTIRDTGREWVFTVNVFNAKEDTGVIEGTYTLTYKIDSGKQAWVYEDNLSSWSPIPMGKNLKHKQLGDYVTVNQCYKLKKGEFLYDGNHYAKAMERYYKGDPKAPVTGAQLTL